MSEKQPFKDAPPSYEAAAAQHGTAPVPNAAPLGGKPPLPRGPFPLDLPILNSLRGKRVILASASPRRKQLLSMILKDIEVHPCTKPEDLSKEQLGPFQYVLETANRKALDVYEELMTTQLASVPVSEPALVIAADTVIVTVSGKILEKPTSEAGHKAMLRMLRDTRVHKVYTAVVVIAPREDARSPGYNMETTVEETKVVFSQDSSDEFIDAYVRTREGVDKAGGYGIQGMGSLLVEKIEGSWDNVVGMPVRATLKLIERAVLNQEDLDEEAMSEEDDE